MTKSATPRSALSAVTALCAALALAGCSMIPVYNRPAAPVAVDWPVLPANTSATGELSAVPAADLEWQDFFSDPKLKQLITTALNNNRDLRVAVLNIESARAQFQIRSADQLPSVNASVSGLRQPNINGNGSISSSYTAGLAVTAYELDFFGRVASLKEAALAQFLATQEGRKTIQISLIASVANTYLALLADEELLAITQQTLATRQDSLKLSQLRFDNGVSSELDLRLAESLTEVTRVSLAQQLRQRAVDQNTLTLLLGQSLTPELMPRLATGSGLATMPLLQDVPSGLPSDLLARRPDVRQAEQLLLASNANIGAARAAFFPRISLTTSAGSASSHLGNLFQSGSYGWTLAPQLVLPIFDAGRNQAGLDGARVQRDTAVAQYEKAIQVAFREVADALAGRATLGEQSRAQQAQADAETIRFRLADLRYQNGVSNQLELLDAQRSLFTARQAAVLARLAQLQGQVTLYKTLGGGWKEAALNTAP
ncbi:Outer membrane protein OprM [Polaromonas vacuolata]|uniref:Outer membrane protein OprM n=1 Tax=Polaromonas vacuolata TaxID=37448 RepID=A0A6H2HB72_9BURK|nr:efflux transporter outer membrane subunit [Polaromonas vacuolata]QJC57131.1 Outer membrane protein OprM [Polaromonas vacuolata]